MYRDASVSLLNRRMKGQWMSGVSQVCALITATLVLSAPTHSQTTTATERSQRIAIWGSSVANGSGDELAQGGYAGRLAALLEPRGWSVINQSRGGDNTVTITPRFEPGESPDPDTRYLTSAKPAYVVIGLSLGNEGIAQCQWGQSKGCTSSLAEADAIFDQFATGMQRLISRARSAGITPVIALPYARSDFSEREYGYTRRMNLLINSWDVPSVNLLGAIDDGQGRWGRGLWGDPLHPNAAGHTEMAYSFVPSLFAALESGKPTPKKSDSNGFMRVQKKGPPPISLGVSDIMHSFAVSFMVRSRKDGDIAAISGRKLDHGYSDLRRSYGDFQWDTESLQLSSSESLFATSLSIRKGRIGYQDSNGRYLSSPVGNSDDDWHYVTLSHSLARGESSLFIDGVLIGSVVERLQPESFELGGANADYKEWTVHRASLNSDEVAALHGGTLLQASLELYAPLAEDGTNLAQSLSEITVDLSSAAFASDH